MCPKPVKKERYCLWRLFPNLIQGGVDLGTNPWAISGLDSSHLGDRRVRSAHWSSLRTQALRVSWPSFRTPERCLPMAVAVTTPWGWCRGVGGGGSFGVHSQYRFPPLSEDQAFLWNLSLTEWGKANKQSLLIYMEISEHAQAPKVTPFGFFWCLRTYLGNRCTK